MKKYSKMTEIENEQELDGIGLPMALQPHRPLKFAFSQEIAEAEAMWRNERKRKM
jgi:hypothetical protein